MRVPRQDNKFGARLDSYITITDQSHISLCLLHVIEEWAGWIPGSYEINILVGPQVFLFMRRSRPLVLYAHGDAL